jgi:hypothetical protein
LASDVAGWKSVVVALQFAVGDLEQVNAQDVGETHEVDGHVGELVTDVVGPVGVHDLGGLLRGEPLEDLEQLPDLAGQRHRQVLGRVELLPVPLSGELTQPQASDYDEVAP